VPGSKTVTCRRCGAQAVAEQGGDDTVRVPPGWRRIAVLSAGPGTWLAGDDLDVFEVSDGYWLCPAHPGQPG
jgi:hypothetical protein